MEQIPTEVMEKIEAVALALYPIYEGELEKYNWESEPCRKDYIAAAIYGYQLAASLCEEKEKEIAELKKERTDLIKQIREFISAHEKRLLPNEFIYEDAKMTLNSIGE